jgi:general secretion pathway protein B
MSILLEALRKTEKNQHSHEAPTIHADDQSGPVAEPFKIGPLALLLVAALFVSGWFVWRQYQDPAGNLQPAVAVEEEKESADPAIVDNSGESTQLATQVTDSDKSTTGQRTPVESYQEAIRNVSKSKTAVSKATPDDQVGTQVTDAGQTRSKAKQLEDAVRSQPVPHPATTAGEKRPPSRKAGSDNSAAADGEKQRTPKTTPISYWELPDGIRADVPEIKFSVLVYANNPADRFVLINGQRLGEGDSPQPGLKIEEIRLDGVVFSYNLYQFLVER